MPYEVFNSGMRSLRLRLWTVAIAIFLAGMVVGYIIAFSQY